jgi:hypothetical protein
LLLTPKPIKTWIRPSEEGNLSEWTDPVTVYPFRLDCPAITNHSPGKKDRKNGAKEGNKDTGEIDAIDSALRAEEIRGDQATHEGANNTNDNIPNDTKAAAFYNTTGQPASN